MRRYEAGDYVEMARWYDAHGLRVPPRDMLPEVGLIEPGVAAGFLYSTDARLALVEGYVSNPRAGPKVRNAALDGITRGLVELAAERGARCVVALTSCDPIVRRALRHGFRDIGPRSMLVREV